MQKALKILIYLIIGIILLSFILVILNVFMRSPKEERESESVQIQYIEIKGKHGNVKVHTGMIKDSVQILVGKPDEVDLRSYGNTTIEDWGYKIKNNYVSDLDIEFENGELKAVRQN